MENSDIQSIKKKTLSGLIWRFCERFLAQIVTFIVSIVIARLLLPEDYGIVAIVTVFIALADVLVTSGLGTALIQKEDADDSDFSTLFYSGLVLSIVLYFIIFFAASPIAKLYSNDLIVPVLRVMGLRIPIAAINSIQQAFVVRNMQFKKFFFSTLIGTLISGAVGIGMAVAGYGVWALVGQYLSNTVIDTFVLFVTISWKPKLLFSTVKFKSLFSYGWKIMASSFIGVLFNKAKNLVIGAKYTEADLAYYTKGENFPLLVSSNIESTIDSVVFSTLSKEQNDLVKVKRICGKFLGMGSFIIIPLMVGMAAVGENMIRLLLTEKWLACVPYLQIVCMGQIFSLISTVNLQVYKAIGRSDVVLKLEFIKKPILLGIIIGMMFISPMAIAIGVACYEVIAAVINSFMSKKLIGFSFWEQLKELLPSLFVGVIMGAGVYFMKYIPIHYVIVLVLQVVCGIGVYVGLSLIFNKKHSRYLIDLLLSKKKDKVAEANVDEPEIGSTSETVESENNKENQE